MVACSRRTQRQKDSQSCLRFASLLSFCPSEHCYSHSLGAAAAVISLQRLRTVDATATAETVSGVELTNAIVRRCRTATGNSPVSCYEPAKFKAHRDSSGSSVHSIMFQVIQVVTNLWTAEYMKPRALT
jgi:hypothetical protein